MRVNYYWLGLKLARTQLILHHFAPTIALQISQIRRSIDESEFENTEQPETQLPPETTKDATDDAPLPLSISPPPSIPLFTAFPFPSPPPPIAPTPLEPQQPQFQQTQPHLSAFRSSHLPNVLITVPEGMLTVVSFDKNLFAFQFSFF